jgi:hypothetical protein
VNFPAGSTRRRALTQLGVTRLAVTKTAVRCASFRCGGRKVTGRRLADGSKIPYRKIQPPKNMAVIRSGVSWEHGEGEQLKDYRERIRPALDAGMDYLRNNPRDTGCFALRQVNCISGPGDELAEACSLGAFVSLARLESWAKDHPSHLAIHTRAMAARRKYQDQRQLRTYNEIFIVEANNPPFNCHSRTGLLPYAQMLAAAGACRRFRAAVCALFSKDFDIFDKPSPQRSRRLAGQFFDSRGGLSERGLAEHLIQADEEVGDERRLAGGEQRGALLV